MANIPRGNSLFFNKRKNTTHDWKFMDRIIRETFYVGGTDLHIYKLIGSHSQFDNMISSANPNLEFTATNVYADHRDATKPFDGNPESFYKNSLNNQPYGNEYIQIDFGESEDVDCLGEIVNGFGYKQHGVHTTPTQILITASQNGVTWAELGIFSMSDQEEIQRFEFINTTRYRYYRIVQAGSVFDVLSHPGSDATWEVSIIELYSEAGRYGVQDPVFMETRDRKYSNNTTNILCYYEIPEKPHDLSKFGYIIPSDQLEITILRSDIELILGRLISIGDIVTLPHLTDDSHDDGGLPNNLDGKRYEVVDVSIAATGYDMRWRDHLQRMVVAPLKDKQEVYDISGDPKDCDAPDCDSNSRDAHLQVTRRIENEAANAGEHGQDLSNIGHGPDITYNTGPRTQDAIPPNSEPYREGLDFPTSPSPTPGDWFRHLGFDPIKLYRWSGTRWIKQESDHRGALDGRDTMKGLLKDVLGLPLTGSSIQQSLKDKD